MLTANYFQNVETEAEKEYTDEDNRNDISTEGKVAALLDSGLDE